MHSPLTRPSDTDGPPAKSPAKSDGRWSFVRFLLVLALLAWLMRSFVFAPFSIPSGSMLPTLYIGDYLAVAKWPYGYSRYSFPFGFPSFAGRILSDLPERGDVVVFRHPGENLDLIKRVIALPDDTVEIRNGALILNGKPIPRQNLGRVAIPMSPNTPCKVVPPATAMVRKTATGPVCLYSAYRESLPGGPSYTVLDQVNNSGGDNYSALRVPSGHVFLMGDNRDDSADSRFAIYENGIGMVPIDHLIGRALVTFWSTDGSASYWKPWTWFTALRGSRIGNDYSDRPQ